MYSLSDAKRILKQNLASATPLMVADWYDRYVFYVDVEDDFEGSMDPYFAVVKSTGEFEEFPLLLNLEVLDILTPIK
jgi:hypothetical protein